MLVLLLLRYLVGPQEAYSSREDFQFYTTKHTMSEVRKYIPYIAEKSGIEKEIIEYALLLLPIRVYSKEFYKDTFKKAKELIVEIDRKDINILALVFKLRASLWSEDRDFERVEGITLLKTKDIL